MTAKAAFEPHRIDREQLKPLKDAVIVSDMNFKERISRGGLILPTDNGKSSGIRPRWGRVYAVGPDQQDIKVGTWVCVEHGRWTRGLELVDESGPRTIRKIDPDCVMMVSDEEECPDAEGISSAVHIEKQEMPG